MENIDDLLQRVFRLARFRPHQREIIADVLAGHDVVCVMPTGAGKSLCFQLPALVLGGLTLVVSPLIALMADQVQQLRALDIPLLVLVVVRPGGIKPDAGPMRDEPARFHVLEIGKIAEQLAGLQ